MNGLFTIRYIGTDRKPFMFRASNELHVEESTLFTWFNSFALSFKWVSGCDGDTYNPMPMAYEHFYRQDGFRQPVIPRPLVILDPNGKRMFEADVRELVETYPSRMPKHKPAQEDVRTYRKAPVAGTGRGRSLKFLFRSKCTSFYEDDLRSDGSDKSWKKCCKCRRAWMKHGTATKQQSIRSLQMEKALMDEVLLLQEIDAMEDYDI